MKGRQSRQPCNKHGPYISYGHAVCGCVFFPSSSQTGAVCYACIHSLVWLRVFEEKKNSWREKQAWLARQPFRHGAVGATERLTFAANAKSQVCLKHLAPLM